MFSKEATKINEIFTVDLTLCSHCQIYGEDFVNFCGTNFTENHQKWLFSEPTYPVLFLTLYSDGPLRRAHYMGFFPSHTQLVEIKMSIDS